MPFARASELDRLLACPGSLVLPRNEVKPKRVQEAADYGTMVHKWKETGEVPNGRLGLTLKKKITLSGTSRDAYWSDGLHEVPLAYNVLTREARALVVPVPSEAKDAWKAAFGDEWVTGTTDIAGLLLEFPWVDDLKTGRRVEYLEHRAQQAFYALVWTLTQMGGLTTARSTITHWPKYPLNNKPRRFGVVLEPEFFLEFQGKLHGLRESVLRLKEKKESGMEISGYLSEGPQCTYCPSKLACTKGQKYV